MMQIDAIERYVDLVLENKGLFKGEKGLLWQFLHHLYTAATMFHLMTDEQRALIGRIQTELSAFFVTKIVLKERKRKGRKRKIPPTPPIKVKETRKIHTLRHAAKFFIKSVWDMWISMIIRCLQTSTTIGVKKTRRLERCDLKMNATGTRNVE